MAHSTDTSIAMREAKRKGVTIPFVLYLEPLASLNHAHIGVSWRSLLGRFTLDAAISTVPIRRNLLGRDFFQHIQLGLREYHQSFFIAPTP